MEKLYKYQLKENIRINNSLIKLICDEMGILKGILIIYRMGDKTNRYVYVIKDDYRIIIYKNGTYGTKIKFR